VVVPTHKTTTINSFYRRDLKKGLLDFMGYRKSTLFLLKRNKEMGLLKFKQFMKV